MAELKINRCPKELAAINRTTSSKACKLMNKVWSEAGEVACRVCVGGGSILCLKRMWLV
jgi:hypothetical protein